MNLNYEFPRPQGPQQIPDNQVRTAPELVLAKQKRSKHFVVATADAARPNVALAIGLITSYGCTFELVDTDKKMLMRLAYAPGTYDFVLCDYWLTGETNTPEVIETLVDNSLLNPFIIHAICHLTRREFPDYVMQHTTLGAIASLIEMLVLPDIDTTVH